MCDSQQSLLFFQLGRLFQMLEAVGSWVEKEELLYKCKNHELNTVAVDDWSPVTKKLLKALPYSLTPSQLNAVKEIIWDLRRPVPMNRLLQVSICVHLSYFVNQTFHCRFTCIYIYIYLFQFFFV